MDSIVLELQKEAIDSDTNISDLLRKSLVIARKLGIKEFEDWGKQELNGYKNNTDKTPQYREIKATLQWFNEYRGWCPVASDSYEIKDIIESVKLYESITELEQLVRVEENNLFVMLTNKQQKLISELSETGYAQFRLLFGKSQAQRIIDMARNIILEWTLKLEEDGILGEGIRFSQKEKQEADKQNYSVNNFYGNTSGVQIQQHTQHSTQTQINEMDLEKVSAFILNLQGHLDQIELNEDNQKAIETEIESITKQLSKRKPETKVVKESIKTIRSLLEGVAGNFIAHALLMEIGKFI